MSITKPRKIQMYGDTPARETFTIDFSNLGLPDEKLLERIRELEIEKKQLQTVIDSNKNHHKDILDLAEGRKK